MIELLTHSIIFSITTFFLIFYLFPCLVQITNWYYYMNVNTKTEDDQVVVTRVQSMPVLFPVVFLRFIFRTVRKFLFVCFVLFVCFLFFVFCLCLCLCLCFFLYTTIQLKQQFSLVILKLLYICK